MMTQVTDTGNIFCSGVLPNNAENHIENEYRLSEDGKILHLQMVIKTADGKKVLVNTHRQFTRTEP